MSETHVIFVATIANFPQILNHISAGICPVVFFMVEKAAVLRSRYSQTVSTLLM